MKGHLIRIHSSYCLLLLGMSASLSADPGSPSVEDLRKYRPNPLPSLCQNPLAGEKGRMAIHRYNHYYPNALSQVLCAHDGPYVVWKGSAATVHYQEGNTWKTVCHEGAFTFDLPGISQHGLLLTPEGNTVGASDIPDNGRLFIIGAFEGNFGKMRRLLESHHVVDGSGHWTYGSGHLIFLGGIAGRGERVVESYWFIRSLEFEAIKAGGSVQFLLGNQEAKCLNDDFRMLNTKYCHEIEGLPPLAMRFGANSEMGCWLAKKSTVLKAGPFLLIQAGLNPDLSNQVLNLQDYNQQLRTNRQWHIATDDSLLGGLQSIDVTKTLARYQTHYLVTNKAVNTEIALQAHGSCINIPREQSADMVLIWEGQQLFHGRLDGTKTPLNP